MEIRPNEGAGDLRFGMTRAEVAALLGPPDHSFLKTPASKNKADVHESAGLHLYYTPRARLRGIEFCREAAPTLHGQTFIGKSLREVLRALRQLDPRTKEDNAGCSSPALRISVYAPGAVKRRDAAVESVYVSAAK